MTVTLAVTAVVAVGAGVAGGASHHQELATGTGRGGATTPVLSARRAPSLVAAGTARRRLRAELAPLQAKAGPGHCLSASSAGVSLATDSADVALMPGSNLKLATAFALLREIPPDTRFSTRLAAGVPPKGGKLDGDLWFIGEGDPLLATADYVATNKYGVYPHTALESIADQLVSSGITHITGSIRGDDSRYDDQRTVPSWPARYLSDRQVGPLTALSVNDARGGGDPATSAAAALTGLLRARGVTVDGEAASGRAPAKLATILDVPSLTVREIVDEMLTFSDNNTAELMLKELGFHRSNSGTTAAGVSVVRDELARAGIPLTGFEEVDGSGLDRGDRVTCTLLAAILTTDGVAGSIAGALPVAARTGTLSERYHGSPAAGKVRAKTGTLKDVTALSGWVHTDPGADVAFSYLLNTGGRDVGAADLRLAEQITEVLLRYPETPDLDTIAPRPARTG